ncbi:MAG: type 2 lanthipeptide synthetase LanM family protein [Halobaculum sp.]
MGDGSGASGAGGVFSPRDRREIAGRALTLDERRARWLGAGDASSGHVEGAAERGGVSDGRESDERSGMTDGRNSRESDERSGMSDERNGGGETEHGDSTHERTESIGRGPEPGETLDAWRDRFPDESAWRARLARDDLTPETAATLATPRPWPADEPLPAWLDRLESLIGWLQSRSASEREEIRTYTVEETPFPTVVGAIVAYAAESVDAQTREAFTPGAWESLTAWCRRRLVALTRRPLFVEFRSFLELEAPERADATPAMFDDPPSDSHEEFVRRLFDGGFASLCVEYPTLARGLVTRVRQWREAVTDLVSRLRTDADLLAERFDADPVLPVRAAEPQTTDTHGDGRSPVRIETASGVELAYKPRHVETAVVVGRIVERLDDAFPDPAPRVPETVARDGYGWQKWIPHRDPEDEAAVERYYTRAGTLLCLADVLGIPDLQAENLRVCGDAPIVVDWETAFSARVRADRTEYPTGAATLAREGVLWSSLLPWTVAPADYPGRSGDRSHTAGFGADSDPQELSDQQVRLTNLGTDLLRVEWEPVTVERDDNTPSVDGVDHPPHEYTDRIVAAYDRTYRAIRRLHEADAFVGDVLRPAELAGVRTRLLFRGTRRYAALRREAVGREPLRDGLAASVVTESLAAPFENGRIERADTWPLLAAERRALARGDTPRFTCPADGVTVSHDGEPVGVPADTSGLAAVRDRLDAMSDADRHRQRWLVQAALDPGGETLPTDSDWGRDVDHRSGPTPAPATADGSITDAPLPSDERLRETAALAADRIAAAQVETGSQPTWAHVANHAEPSSLVVASAGDSVHDGRAGIALALAAVARVTGEATHWRLAARALDAVDPEPDRPGGTAGVGGTVYALAVGSELLDAPRFAERARDVVRRVTPEAHTTPEGRFDGASEAYDVVHGTAGTILGLVAAHERVDVPVAVETAVACGDALLDARTTVDGYRVWETMGEAVTVGWAHGTPGIAAALARLGEVTGATRFTEAASEAFAYGDTRYDPAARNWRRPDERPFADRWCYGRAGVGLARLAADPALDRSLLTGFDGGSVAGHDSGSVAEHDVTDVVRASATAELPVVDNACCGTAGRVAFCARAVDAGHADRETARRLFGRALERLDGDRLALPGNTDRLANPTLLDGWAGVALVAARLVDPSLPAVLTFE